MGRYANNERYMNLSILKINGCIIEWKHIVICEMDIFYFDQYLDTRYALILGDDLYISIRCHYC